MATTPARNPGCPPLTVEMVVTKPFSTCDHILIEWPNICFQIRTICYFPPDMCFFPPDKCYFLCVICFQLRFICFQTRTFLQHIQIIELFPGTYPTLLQCFHPCCIP